MRAGVLRTTTAPPRARLLAGLPVLLTLVGCAPPGGVGRPDSPQAPAPPPLVDREWIEAFQPGPLSFRPPVPERLVLSSGVTVFLVEDHALPLVELRARFRGGASHFPRELYGAATGLAAALRTGGTVSLPPDSVDQLIDLHALEVGLGGGGQASFASVGALDRHFDMALRLWADLLRNPRLDAERVEIWRTRELEFLRRTRDNPGFHAAVEFNRLMYGEHPIGRVLEEEDLTPEMLAEARLRTVHRAIYCPANMVLGVTGAITAAELLPLLEEVLADWPECLGELIRAPAPEVRDRAGIFLLPRELEQSTVYLAHAGGVTQAEGEDYFASRIANAILGGGGFSSRIMSEVRGRHGYAYGASSFWTAPRDHQGVFGATTTTRSDATVAAIEVIRGVVEEMRLEPPTEEEVVVAVEHVVNSFVFNFETAAQVVDRHMLYHAEDMPMDWLERYLEGIQEVTPGDVHRVMRRYARPEDFTILVLGDSAAFAASLETLGPVTVLESP